MKKHLAILVVAALSASSAFSQLPPKPGQGKPPVVILSGELTMDDVVSRKIELEGQIFHVAVKPIMAAEQINIDEYRQREGGSRYIYFPSDCFSKYKVKASLAPGKYYATVTKGRVVLIGKNVSRDISGIPTISW